MAQWTTRSVDGHGDDPRPRCPPHDAEPKAARPLTVRVASNTPHLTQLIARAVERQGFSTIQASAPTATCMLQYRAHPMPAALEPIVAVLNPIRLEARHEPKLDVDAVVSIGQSDKGRLSRWRLRLRSDDPRLVATGQSLSGNAGFTITPASEQPSFLAAATLRYGGADEHACAVLSWLVLQLGCEAPQQIKAWGDEDRDIYLDLPAPAAPGVPLRQRIPVTIRADTPEVFATLEPLLRTAGFVRIGIERLIVTDDSRLRLDPGVLPAIGEHVALADTVRALDQACRSLEIDCARYPLELPDRGAATEGGIIIEVPLAAMRRGLLRPWSRLQPGRYEVIIHDDDREAGFELVQKLKSVGFNAHRCRLSSISEGFAVRAGASVPESLRQLVSHEIDLAMLRCGAGDFVLAVSTTEGEKIEVEFAADAHRSGRLRAELEDPGRYAIKIIAPRAAAAQKLADDLKSRGFHRIRIEVDSDDDPSWIRFGGARPHVLDQIDAAVAHQYGRIKLPRQKTWPASDHDIYLRLPASVASEPTPVKPAARPSGRSRQAPPAMPESDPPQGGPLIEVTERAVRVGDMMLEKPAKDEPRPPAPVPTWFDGFCIDQPVAETLYFTAQAVRGRYPAALEGPTAASKTWALFYLAAQLGVGVYRVNLSAHSDVSELIGRFVPDTARPGAFRFQYGPAPRAMTEGAWLVIDEANLAPSEVLERCNSMLEMPEPSLMLAEYDGRLITATHARFRVLATWNGLGYVGRQELSPAFIDRFKVRVCAAPSEADYRALGQCLVHGSQPPVLINGVRYAGSVERPLFPELATLIAEFDRFNTALARFQAGIAAMAERGELRGRGPIAFTRRSFVDVLRETCTSLPAGGASPPSRAAQIRAVWQALCFCHLQRLDPEEERPKAVALLTACGIGAEQWKLPQ